MEPKVSDLAAKHCKPCEGGTPPVGRTEAAGYLAGLTGWEIQGDRGDSIAKTFQFANFFETMAFVNAVAWVADREDHHPDLEVSYKKCRVRYSTHAVGGLSENDFICAARIEALLT